MCLWNGAARTLDAMPRRDRLILRAFSLWSFFVWGVLIRNMLRDDEHGAGFRAVHIALAVVSISLGVATWRVATRAKRRSDASERSALSR
jgi:hypothetical protein